MIDGYAMAMFACNPPVRVCFVHDIKDLFADSYLGLGFVFAGS